MENLILLLATSFALRLNSPRKFKNVTIGHTGCSALLLQHDNSIDSTVTESGDRLYFHEAEENGVGYGMICVDMRTAVDQSEAMTMLEAYMDSLRGPFYVLHNTGVHAAANWNQASVSSLTDYWQDSQGVDYKVKGYTNGRVLAILFVRNISQLDVSLQDQYLDSFHCAHSE
jgi:hypothetical protein